MFDLCFLLLQAGEIQALQKRMEATQESHLREMQNSQAQMSNLKTMLDQSSAPELQRLKEVDFQSFAHLDTIKQ